MVTGASGFIGSHLARVLIQEGHKVVLCVRDPLYSQQQWPDALCIKVDFTHDHDVTDWLPRLSDVDVVINAVGIIRETGSQTFRAIHALAPCALFKACELANVKKVIQISALGTDEAAFSQYHLTKREADECLMRKAVNWSILMPSIVYGSGAKSMAFFKALATLPWIPLIGKGDQPVQPIHINDLLKIIIAIVQNSNSRNSRIILVGPKAMQMKEIYLLLRNWLGLDKARFVSIPYYLALVIGSLSGFLINTPLTKESVQMLQKGNTADVTPLVNQFGFIPTSFEQYLLNTPAEQSDQWHASLYLLRLLLRFSIAFVWIVTGLISAFVYPVEQSYMMLAKANITGLWAPFILYCAAVTDILLGVATFVGYRLRIVSLIQIAIIVMYTIIITFSQPEQWLHPFGPVTKNIPLIVATLIMIRLERK